MRARGRTDDGEYSEIFKVKQEGLRQGCALSPLLFDVFFFAAVSHIVLMRFSEDQDVMADLIHVDDDGADSGNEPIERLRRAAWEMLYADDADVVSESPVGLTKFMTAIVKSSEAASLAASDKEDGGHATAVQAPHQAPQTEPLVTWKQSARGTSRQVRLPVLRALSTQTTTSCPRSNEGSGSPGRALESTLISYTTDLKRRSRCTSRSMSMADEMETLAFGGVT